MIADSHTFAPCWAPLVSAETACHLHCCLPWLIASSSLTPPAAKLTAQLCQNLHIGKQQICLADNNAQAVGNDPGLTAELWQKRTLCLGGG